jgi:hypothetical protein
MYSTVYAMLLRVEIDVMRANMEGRVQGKGNEKLQQPVADTVRRRQSAVTSNHSKYMKERRKELGLAIT